MSGATVMGGTPTVSREDRVVTSYLSSIEDHIGGCHQQLGILEEILLPPKDSKVGEAVPTQNNLLSRLQQMEEQTSSLFDRLTALNNAVN